VGGGSAVHPPDIKGYLALSCMGKKVDRFLAFRVCSDYEPRKAGQRAATRRKGMLGIGACSEDFGGTTRVEE
jgi:hypothetical protein